MSDAPAGLKARGRALWDSMASGVELLGDERVILHEACRLADRLDRLDFILSGKERPWLTIDLEQLREPGEPIQLIVDKCLGEARQQAVALNQIVKGLRDARTERLKSSPPVEIPNSLADQLQERRMEKEAERRAASGQ